MGMAATLGKKSGLLGILLLASCVAPDSHPDGPRGQVAELSGYEAAFYRVVDECKKCDGVHYFGPITINSVSFFLPTSADAVLDGGRPCMEMLKELSRKDKTLEGSVASKCLQIMEAKNVAKGAATKDRRSSIEYRIYVITF